MLKKTNGFFISRFISMMLVVMIFVEALPVIAIGNLLQDDTVTQSSSENSQTDSKVLFDAEQDDEAVYVLGEETSLRTETEKHLDCQMAHMQLRHMRKPFTILMKMVCGKI